MGMINIHSLTLVTILMGSLGATGCYGEVQAEPVVAEGYEPQYYDGRVVYFDAGRPYYYDNGAQIWVEPSSPYYAGYVNHWNTYGPAYNRWYAGYGYRYRTYRGGGGYYGGHAGYRASPSYRVNVRGGGGYRRR
jgi:hypothetical protein